MAELASGGYAWIRDLIQATTVYLAIYDDSDVQIGSRVSISGDAWSENSNVVTITHQFSGTDFSLPQTIKSSRIYSAATNGTAYTALEPFDEGTATLRANADTLTVYHNIEVPQT